MGERTAVCGSRQGWYAVLCVHVSWLLFAGLIKGLGVMLPTLKEQFATDTWLIGWMIAIISGTGNLLGPGLSIVNILSRAMVGRCFTTNYATAIGIASSGHPLGFVIFAPFIQVLLDTYGWRGALLLLGGFSLHLGVCGALLRSPSTATRISGDYQPVAHSNDDEAESRDSSSDVHGASKKSWLDSAKDALLITKERFGVSVGRRVAFWLAAAIFLCYRFAGAIWQIFFVAQAQAKGFSAYNAVMFTAAGGLGSIAAKIVFGPLVDRALLKLRHALAIVIVVGSLTFVTVPWMNSYWLMMSNAFLCFGAIGATGALSDLFTRELLGVDLLVTAFSWMQLLSGAILFSVGFFPGWMYDQTGSFDMAFVIAGCVWASSLLALFVEWVMTRRKLLQEK
ncbi:monocarboxylate transporter 12-like isoform X2 [Patiria miniata]|uniref:Major facilitator superfamily (MFS) profile domain-containing protein n=1 Tax=Patiria miniata TaxID=46514 RepID=A0A914BAU0_PATMI|nr:monocarboxylate transporter 12-like isoform X2 [Patiria miniata]